MKCVILSQFFCQKLIDYWDAKFKMNQKKKFQHHFFQEQLNIKKKLYQY
jgi:hypothetical protein